MATTADIRNGMVIEYKGHRMKVISFLHVKPGKGGAFVRTKLKNILSGQGLDVTFRSGEKIIPVRLETQNMQYLYSDGDSVVFMDLDNYDQITFSNEVLGEQGQYITEGMIVGVDLIDNEVIGIKPPVFVELEVTETEPGLRGNTATGGTKSAIVETGLSVTVPLFVNIGDKLKIDTRSGEYVERIS